MLKIIASTHILLLMATSGNLLVDTTQRPTFTEAPLIVSEQEKEPIQTLAISAETAPAEIVRDAWVITDPPPPPPPAPIAVVASPKAPSSAPVATGTPTTAQAYAYTQVMAKGWSESDYNCLVSLWKRESGWNASAMNKSSGAYGIPQSLPGSKMASAGADWETNPNTQIDWGLGYISGRYSTPCGAWGHSESVGWY